MKKYISGCLAAAFAVMIILAFPLHSSAQTYGSGDVVTGYFDTIEGRDISTIRYYTDTGRSEYEFADFTYNETLARYEYSFAAPYDGYEDSKMAENVGDENAVEANIVAEYFSTERWDGAVDVSWYDEGSTDFYIDTPAKLAGAAAIVNGVFDGSITDYSGETHRINKDYWIKGDKSRVNAEYHEDSSLIGGATGGAYTADPSHDFSGCTIHITADLDMGGVSGDQIDHYDNNETENKYSFPNWTPIGGEYLMDNTIATSMVLSAFNGVLDGGGHHITNLYCYRYARPGWQYAQGTGLIGCIGVLSQGEEQPSLIPAVRDLSVSGYIYGRRMVGGIVGLAGGASNTHGTGPTDSVRLENLASHVYVYNTDSKGIGGVLGTSYSPDGSVINCYFDGQVSTTYASPAGGIVGANEHMDIFGCYCRGTINTGKAHYGRGIGGTGSTVGNFTVDTCFYLKGCGDDMNYPGYYTYNLPDSVSVNVTELSENQLRDGTLLNGLNTNGTAYTEGDSGYPVLLWEKGRGSGNLTVTEPQGGTVSAECTGAVPDGTVVYLSCTPETGWLFRYFTVNGEPMTGNYVTVCGDTNVSAYMESAKAGTLRISQNNVCDISVKKNGLVKNDEGELTEVQNAVVEPGDSLYENDRLMITAVLKDGAVPADENMDYMAAVGLSSPYSFTFTYTGEEGITSSTPVYTVDSRINGENVTLTLAVTPLTTPKLWHSTPDTSWFTGNKTTYTLTTGPELAGFDKLVEDGEDFAGITILLGNDISLTNTDGTSGIRSWDGIGDNNHYFSGKFDGQGHTVTDYHGVRRGLFAYCRGESGDPAVIRNVSVYGSGSGAFASGIAAKAQYTEISGCSSYVVITNASSYAGGILANDLAGTSVDNCCNYGSIEGSGVIGGIAGCVSSAGSLTDCINKGNIRVLSTANNQTGGVTGTIAGAVMRCANYGDILAYGRNTGGIAGQSTVDTAVITDCYNVGNLTYNNGTSTLDSIGGLIGYGNIYKLTNCYNYGSVERTGGTMKSNVGSLIGRHIANSKSSIESVYVRNGANSSGFVISGNNLGALKLQNSEFYAGLSESDASEFADSEGVLGSINGNGSFVLTNGNYPELSVVSSVHVHGGGEATCSTLAVCSECGLSYGEYDPDHHEEEEVRNYKDAVWAYDGYTGDICCSACGAVITEGTEIKADTSREAMTAVLIKDGEDYEEKTYTVADLDTLKKSSPSIGYMFGAESREAMVSTEYVELSSILEDFSIGIDNIDNLRIICSGSTQDISGDDIRSCIWYFDADGNRSSAPPAFGITYSTETGTIDEIAAVTQPHDDIRFGYGISQKQYDDRENVGGRRCVSPVERVEITYRESDGAGIKVSDYTQGSQDTSNKTASVEGNLITDEDSFTGTVTVHVSCDHACVVALENDDGTYTRLSGNEASQGCDFVFDTDNRDVKLVIALKGDTDLNGRITSKDGSITMKAAVNKFDLTGLQELAADADANGRITSKDGSIILKSAVGKYTAQWDVN